MILDWKKLAQNIYWDLKEKIKKLERAPRLGVILVGDSSASLRYIWQKKKFCEKIGMSFRLFQLPASVSEKQLLLQVKNLNHDPSISGYIIQLPLPEHIDSLRIIRNIDPKKDVDGFHPENIGKMMIGDLTGFHPCTPAGVMKIFSEYEISLRWKNVVVLGQSNIVWKPMAIMCIHAWASVISCNHSTPDISLYTKNADIVISATWKAHLLNTANIKKNTLVIDVGFSIIEKKIYGDADTEKLLEQWNSVSPVPGGVGPMTVAMLLTNTYLAHIRRI